MKTPKYFYLSKAIPDIGWFVCVSGYPLSQISTNNQGGLELSGVRRYFQPTFVLDKGVVNSDNDHGKSANRMAFSFIQSRVSQNSSGRTILVENTLVIRSNLILDLLKEIKIRTIFKVDFKLQSFYNQQIG